MQVYPLTIFLLLWPLAHFLISSVNISISFSVEDERSFQVLSMCAQFWQAVTLEQPMQMTLERSSNLYLEICDCCQALSSGITKRIQHILQKISHIMAEMYMKLTFQITLHSSLLAQVIPHGSEEKHKHKPSHESLDLQQFLACKVCEGKGGTKLVGITN